MRQWRGVPRSETVQVNANTVALGDSIDIGGCAHVVVHLLATNIGTKTVQLDSGIALVLHSRSRINAVRTVWGGRSQW